MSQNRYDKKTCWRRFAGGGELCWPDFSVYLTYSKRRLTDTLVDFTPKYGCRGRGETLLRTEKKILRFFCTPLLQNISYCWRHLLFPSISFEFEEFETELYFLWGGWVKLGLGFFFCVDEHVDERFHVKKRSHYINWLGQSKNSLL